MFCPVCGNQLPDGAQFCNKCGASIGGAAPNKAPRAKKPFALPTESEKFKLVFNLVAALFIFLPWIRIEGGAGIGFSLVSGLMFDVNALFGICKIFLILGLVAFGVYVAASYIDLAKFGLESALIKTFALLGFYGAYALSILFSFIGALVKDGYADTTTLNTPWYFMLVIVAIGALINFIPKKSK